MTVAIGQRGAVGMGLEMVWAVPTAPTHYLEVYLSDVRARIDVEPVETVRGCRSHRAVAAGPVLIGGAMQGPVSADSIGLLLYTTFGQVETTELAAPGGGNPGVYQHVFTRQAGTDLPSVTLEQNLGGVTSRRTLGCRMDELTLAVRRAGILTFEAELVGCDEGMMTPTTPTFATDDFLHYRGFSAVLDGVENTDLEEAEVTFGNGLVTGLAAAGGNGRISRLPASSFAVSGRFTMLATTTNLELSYIGGQTFPLSLMVAGSRIQGLHYRQLQVDLPRVRLSGATVPLAPGRLAHEVEFLALLDPTEDNDCQVTLISTVASYG